MKNKLNTHKIAIHNNKCSQLPFNLFTPINIVIFFSEKYIRVSALKNKFAYINSK